MKIQNSLAVKLIGTIYNSVSRLIHASVACSPFLTRAFNEVRRMGRSFTVRFVMPNPITIEGHVLFHNEDPLLMAPLSIGIYETEIQEIFKEFLRPGMTMIDVGANIGCHTLLAARMVGPQGHVYAFEPVPSLAALLRKNVEVNGYSDRVTIIPKAVTDKSQQVRIFLDMESPASSNMFEISHKDAFEDAESVSLDEFFSKKAWPPIHFVKMDIEGAEKLALDGMRELSRRNPELILVVEVNPKCFSVEEIVEALRACGFSRHYLLWEGDRLVVNTLKDIPHISRGGMVNFLCKKES